MRAQTHGIKLHGLITDRQPGGIVRFSVSSRPDRIQKHDLVSGWPRNIALCQTDLAELRNVIVCQAGQGT